jgi:lysosomal acid lipase/cholesteryl ester hydrolase
MVALIQHPHPCSSAIDPDETRDTIQLIESRGFAVQVHYTTTHDGYILALHRMVNPSLNATGKPVILQHGLISSSSQFIINNPEETLENPPVNILEGPNIGFSLCRIGYDVWLPNMRGNTYSRNHTSLDPEKDSAFWDYTWDDHALSDLPAVIDYVRSETGSQTVAYVGHSQGVLSLLALLSSRKEYNDVIKPFIALAPVAVLKSMKSPIKYLAHNSFLVEYFKWKGGQFLPSDRYMRRLAEQVCDSRYMTVCANVMFLLSGFDGEQLNMTRLGVYFSHMPAGTSAWNIIHYVQQYQSKSRIQMYDYGRMMNIRKYGQEEPPEYHLERISNRYIALMSGQNDWLVNPVDLLELRRKLRVPLIMDYVVENPKWNHQDFLLGKDAGKYINCKIIELLHRYA